MTIRPDGNFDVDPCESICLTTTKSQPNFAATSQLQGATWASEKYDPKTLTSTKTFVCPKTPGSKVYLAMLFDFQPDNSGAYDPGDNYVVRLEGKATDPPLPQMQIDPPPIVNRTFIFFVR